MACSQPISSHLLGTWRGQVACSRPISCHPLPYPRCSAHAVWAGGMLSPDILRPSCEHLGARWPALSRYPPILWAPGGARWHALGRYPVILVHTLGVLRVTFGQVACSQPISCHPVSPCGPGGLLPADILPSFGHLAGPGGLLPADNLSSSAVPLVFCACRLGRWHALTRYPAIL